uniref:Uncharacterized protein n=1 Tax=Anguilla anguilla TaxID=7936 RepID=A0A0E9PF54_ANGAN
MLITVFVGGGCIKPLNYCIKLITTTVSNSM